jgi:hypothetical protein
METSYGLDGRSYIPDWEKVIFFLLRNIQTGSGDHLAYCTVVTFPGVTLHLM